MADAEEQVAFEEAERRKKRRRLVIVTSVLLALVFTCCGACGLAMVLSSRHARDVRRFTPIPPVDATGETDRFYALLAASRTTADLAGDCRPTVANVRAALTSAGPAEARAFQEWLRQRVAELDRQDVRDTCGAALYGACPEHRFLAYRAYLVAMGRPTVEQARRDPDALVDGLPRDVGCEDLTWVANAAHQASVADGGPVEDLPRLGEASRTVARSRQDLKRYAPRTCERFTCTPGDLLDD